MALKHLNEQEFKEIVTGGQPAMIDFFADWCGPCKALGPVVEELAKAYEGRAAVAKVDVDEQRALAIGLGVLSVPTVIFLKDGKEAARQVGVQPREEYVRILDSLL